MSDRFSLAHALRTAGIERDAAERVATEIDQMIRGNVATKADVDHLRAELKADIATLETRLTIRAAIIALAGLSALFTALHWWPPSPAISAPAAKPAALLLAADQPPYSCRLLYDEQKKCAFGSCDQRTVERLKRECLRDGGRP